MKIAVIAMMGMSLGVNSQTKIGFNINDAFDVSGNSVAHYGISKISGTGYHYVGLSGYFGLNFYTEGKERVKILKNGNVGIGITNPKAKLTLGYSDSFPNLGFLRKDGAQSVSMNVNSNNQFVIQNSSGSGDFDIRTNIAGRSVSSAFFIEGLNGNVGIGTTDPKAKLEVTNNSYGSQLASFSSNGRPLVIGAQQKYVYLGYGNLEQFKIIGTTGEGRFVFGRSTNDDGVHLLQVGGSSIFKGDLTAKKGLFSSSQSGHMGLRVERNSSLFHQITHDSNKTIILNGDNDIEYRFGGINRLTFKNDGGANFSGKVGIGTTSTGNHKLAVEGSIGAREIKVEASGWSDFVFYNNYNLPTLKEVENHIKEKGHLKDIPSAKEVEKNGFFLGEMDAKLLQKIEELTLYTIAQEKEIKKEKAENKKQQKEIDELKALVQKLLQDKK